MKNIILAVMLMVSAAYAHTIVGTPVLKGTLKTKLFVENVPSTCKVQIEKIWSSNNEDSYGNPGYHVRMDLNLSGYDMESGKTVKFDTKVMLSNMYTVGANRIVKDYEYATEDGKITLTIKTDGRLNSVSFPHKSQKVTCSF
ncbi:hypothetical protein ACJVC5_07175 [Peredibacter sp. HCB2-198]|uniref:hypothetical protein n=1 Tax=Peredibacter sp. HCB2-198 TaxID=3383025 RepID=UPI0038B437BB